MGSTGPSGDGIEFSIAPEQRVRDVVADQWAETISSLNKSGRGDLAEDLVGLGFAPKTKGGFDVGDISNLPSLSTPSFQPNLSEPISAQQSPTAGASPLQLSPEHLTLRPETPSHQQDHGFQVPQDFNRGAFRYDPVATAEHRVQQQGGFNLNMDDSGIIPSSKLGPQNAAAPIDDTVEGRLFADRAAGGFVQTAQPLQRIGTELGEKAVAGEVAAAEGAAGGGGLLGSAAGPIGFAVGAIALAEQAGGIGHSLASGKLTAGTGLADELFAPGKAAHGSIKQVLDAEQTRSLNNFTPSGIYGEAFRHLLMAPFLPKQSHN